MSAGVPAMSLPGEVAWEAFAAAPATTGWLTFRLAAVEDAFLAAKGGRDLRIQGVVAALAALATGAGAIMKGEALMGSAAAILLLTAVALAALVVAERRKCGPGPRAAALLAEATAALITAAVFAAVTLAAVATLECAADRPWCVRRLPPTAMILPTLVFDVRWFTVVPIAGLYCAALLLVPALMGAAPWAAAANTAVMAAAGMTSALLVAFANDRESRDSFVALVGVQLRLNAAEASRRQASRILGAAVHPAALPPLALARNLADALSVEFASCVTVAVAGIHDFRHWSTRHLPIDVVATVHRLFSVFDEACHQAGVRRAGSSGDQYCCVAGPGLLAAAEGPAGDEREAACGAYAVARLMVMVPEEVDVPLLVPPAGRQPGDQPPLQVCVALASGPATGGVTGRSAASLRFLLQGDAPDRARAMLPVVPPGAVQCDSRTFALLGRPGDQPDGWVVPEESLPSTAAVPTAASSTGHGAGLSVAVPPHDDAGRYAAALGLQSPVEHRPVARVAAPQSAAATPGGDFAVLRALRSAMAPRVEGAGADALHIGEAARTALEEEVRASLSLAPVSLAFAGDSAASGDLGAHLRREVAARRPQHLWSVACLALASVVVALADRFINAPGVSSAFFAAVLCFAAAAAVSAVAAVVMPKRSSGRADSHRGSTDMTTVSGDASGTGACGVAVDPAVEAAGCCRGTFAFAVGTTVAGVAAVGLLAIGVGLLPHSVVSEDPSFFVAALMVVHLLVPPLSRWWQAPPLHFVLVAVPFTAARIASVGVTPLAIYPLVFGAALLPLAVVLHYSTARGMRRRFAMRRAATLLAVAARERALLQKRLAQGLLPRHVAAWHATAVGDGKAEFTVGKEAPAGTKPDRQTVEAQLLASRSMASLAGMAALMPAPTEGVPRLVSNWSDVVFGCLRLMNAVPAGVARPAGLPTCQPPPVGDQAAAVAAFQASAAAWGAVNCAIDAAAAASCRGGAAASRPEAIPPEALQLIDIFGDTCAFAGGFARDGNADAHSAAAAVAAIAVVRLLADGSSWLSSGDLSGNSSANAADKRESPCAPVPFVAALGRGPAHSALLGERLLSPLVFGPGAREAFAVLEAAPTIPGFSQCFVTHQFRRGFEDDGREARVVAVEPESPLAWTSGVRCGGRAAAFVAATRADRDMRFGEPMRWRARGAGTVFVSDMPLGGKINETQLPPLLPPRPIPSTPPTFDPHRNPLAIEI